MAACLDPPTSDGAGGLTDIFESVDSVPATKATIHARFFVSWPKRA
jgi:hypothetical protein